jgi:eukaryotic-like serine/threonine-protein kinase
MPDIRTCATCGSELAPDGQCVQCALGLALGAADANRPNSGSPLQTESASTITQRDLRGQPGDKPSDRIGPYKLLQLIGEGGMGSVWMAEQEAPVFRRVALKVIKLGMDTKQVIARFRAEQQALALMDHPNIAKVFEAGATENGRPYFVMELVRGIPITEYCDKEKLSTRERLDLFMQVCQAIQHAHQKGIIHRDIKPSNVLVTLLDGVPPKPLKANSLTTLSLPLWNSSSAHPPT